MLIAERSLLRHVMVHVTASPPVTRAPCSRYPCTAQLPLNDTAQSRFFSRDVRICFDLVFSKAGARDNGAFEVLPE